MNILGTLSIMLLLCLDPTASQSTTKKGVGLAESRGLGLQQLTSLNARWYYNWGSSTGLSTSILFVPMIYSENHINDATSGNFVLGFNEPDNANQSNMSVQEALQLWPSVAAKAATVGSPAMAGNPVTGTWFPQFMAAKPRVNFVCVHWYKGPDLTKFMSDMQAVYSTYNLPVWVTEYAAQTNGDSQTNPYKYSQDTVNTFMKQTSQWMEQTSYMHRYAWHDSGVGTSALFDSNGALTAGGKTWASL
jgi:hypothetical protein